MVNKKETLKKVLQYLDQNFKNESTGHDYWHFVRVWKMAKFIAKKEGGDLLVIELGALLHDVADWKFNEGKDKVGIEKIKGLLRNLNIGEKVINQVCSIIENISFKGARVKNTIATKEGKIVQDADRLDAIGAIGIARAFAYGGKIGKVIYEPKIEPQMHASFEEYKNSKGTSINHFYEKLLLLKDLMNTKTGRAIAVKRHKFMEDYLKDFFKEWEAKI